MKSVVATLYLIAAIVSFAAEMTFALSTNQGQALWPRLTTILTVEGARLLIDPARYAAIGVVLEILCRSGRALEGALNVKRQMGDLTWRSWLSLLLLGVGVATYFLTLLNLEPILRADLGWQAHRFVRYFLYPLSSVRVWVGGRR